MTRKTEQYVVGAIVEVRICEENGRKCKIRDIDNPIKFVDLAASKEDLKDDLHSYWKDIKYECQPWTMAQFAEYMRRQFDKLDDRLHYYGIHEKRDF